MHSVLLDRLLTLLSCVFGVLFLGLAIKNASHGDYGWAAFSVLLALPGFLAVHWQARSER